MALICLAAQTGTASEVTVADHSTPRWSEFDRPVHLASDHLRVQCDEAVEPARATIAIEADEAPGGRDAVRVDYRLAPNGNAIFAYVAQFEKPDLPEFPWGVELWCFREDRAIAVTVMITDEGGELWEFGLPRARDWEQTGWVRFQIPFDWFRLVSWERRDGQLDPSTLQTLFCHITNGDTQRRREGALRLGALALLDARRPVWTTDANDFTLLHLDAAFNSDGVAFRDDPFDGDFHTGDWQHRALPAEFFPTGASATFHGVPFAMPSVANGSDNHIRCNGQRVVGFEPRVYSAAYLLATGKFGSQMGDMVLRYDDGTVARVLLEVSDWSDGPKRGDAVAVTFPKTYYGHDVEDRQPKLYVQSVRIDSSKTLQAIDLPKADYLKVFALTLTKAVPPPAVGALQDRDLADVHPRYAMKTRSELDFSEPARSVGVYGAYLKRNGSQYNLEEPMFNGSLAFALDMEHAVGEPPRFPLVWASFFASDRHLALGQFAFEGDSSAPLASSLLDWTCVEYETQIDSGDGARFLDVLLSRAWPAIQLTTGLSTVHWQVGDGRQEPVVAIPSNDGAICHTVESDAFPAMTEPWLLTWVERPDLDFVVPMLVVVQRRPERVAPAAIEDLGITIAIHFAGEAGGIRAMPLYGIARIPKAEAAAWCHDGLPEEIVARCRAWARRLQRFPVAVTESFRVDSTVSEVSISTRWTARTWDTPWTIEADPVALIPPVIALAHDNGYAGRVVSDVVDSDYSTFWGPAALVAGDMTEVTLSSPRYVASAPIPARVTGAPLTDTIATELQAAVQAIVPNSLDTYRYASAGDVAQLRALAPSVLSLGTWPRGATAYAKGIVEHLVNPNSLKVEKEPISGQYYLMDDRFWAKDEHYDKEWQLGYVLQGLWNYAYYCDDTAFIKAHWDTIRGLYAYFEIVFDWATASTYTMTTGFNANSDGIRIAWEGMLAMARMAEMVGDEATYEDAVARASKQMASLYASWYAPRWAATNQYTMVQYHPIPPGEAELRFAPDNSWTEFFTCNLSHPDDFFQTTHAFYFFNLSHLAFLHDSGLGDRFLRPWLDEVAPSLHPQWCDGNAFSEASGRYYGGDHTMAHLVARALVLGEDTRQLHECYERSVRDTLVSTQWYRPQSVAAETLTAMLMGAAPIVFAPVLACQVLENTFDVTAQVHRIRLRGTHDANAPLYIRTGSRRIAHITSDGAPRDAIFDTATGDLRIDLVLVPDEETVIDVNYS